LGYSHYIILHVLGTFVQSSKFKVRSVGTYEANFEL